MCLVLSPQYNTCHSKTMMKRVLASFGKVTIEHVRKFAKRTRRYRRTYLKLDKIEKQAAVAAHAADLGNRTYSPSRQAYTPCARKVLEDGPDEHTVAATTHADIEALYKGAKEQHIVPVERLRQMIKTHATHRNIFDMEKEVIDGTAVSKQNTYGVAVVRISEDGTRTEYRSVQAAAVAVCAEGGTTHERTAWFNIRRAMQDGVLAFECEWDEGTGRRSKRYATGKKGTQAGLGAEPAQQEQQQQPTVDLSSSEDDDDEIDDDGPVYISDSGSDTDSE